MRDPVSALTCSSIQARACRRREKPSGRFVLASLALAVVSWVACGEANAGLIGHWNFDEAAGSTVLDASGNGFHGTINGATRVAGLHGAGALSFDGANDIVNILTTPGDLFDFNGDTQVTAMAWVNVAGPPGGTCCGQIVGQRDSANAWILRDDRRDTGAEFELIAGTNTGSTGDLSFDGVPRTAIGEWHHIAAVVDLSLPNNEATIYVDGAPNYFFSVGGANFVSGSPADSLEIGGAGDGYFNGLIDEVRVYDEALSQLQVVTAMIGVPEPSSIGLMLFGLLGLRLGSKR